MAREMRSSVDGRNEVGSRRTGRLLAHLETVRPYTLPYVAMVAASGALLAEPDAPGWRVVAAIGVPLLGWVAGLYGGDYFDRDLDARSKPHRPVPSGRLPAATARSMLIGLTLVGGAVAVVVNPYLLGLAALAAATGVAYSTELKKRGLLGNLGRGALIAMAFLFGTMTVRPLPDAWLVAVAAVLLLHDTATNLVGAMRDADGDGAAGYRTLPVRRGYPVALAVAVALYGCAWLGLAALLQRFDRIHPGVWWMLVGAAALAAAAFVVAGTGGPQRVAAYRAHAVLLVERLVLAGSLLALAVGTVPAVLVTLGCVGFTLTGQRIMRRRHEFGDPAGPAEPAEPGPPRVTTADVDDFVDRTLAGLPPAGGSWRRRIRITLVDLDHRVLLTVDGSVRRIEAEGYAALAVPEVIIDTTSRVFHDVFVTAARSPLQAVRAGDVQVRGSARDLLGLNTLFTAFRRVSATTRDRPVAEPAPAESPETDRQPLVVVSDTTLRDGEQMPGVALGAEEKLDLARRLAALGVPLIEAGFPAVSAEERDMVRALVEADLGAAIQAIARPLERDIDAAASTGCDSIGLFVGASDSHIRAKLRTGPRELLASVGAAVAHAKSTGCTVVFAAEDATRADRGFLLELLAAAESAGADSVGLADTAGVAHPAGFADLVGAVCGAVSIPVAVHCHNDLGMAVANSVAAVQAGASGVQCTILGIGERAGNAALEEVALALEVALDRRTGLDLAGLRGLSEHVSGLVGVPIPPTKAVVGAHAFVHESGLHVDGLLRDPRTYEPYPPQLIGTERRFVFGKHSGASAIRHAVSSDADIAYPDEVVERVLAVVKQRGQAKQPMDSGQVRQLARQLSGMIEA